MKLRRVLALTTLSIAIGACADPAPDVRPLSAQNSGGRERLVWQALKPTNWDVYYFAGPQAEPRRLTDDPGPDYDAVFSPDGRWVVFTSERRGNPDLYAIDLQAAGTPRLLIDSPSMEDQAAISPDGTTIAFMSSQGGNADIYTLPFDPASTQSLDKATILAGWKTDRLLVRSRYSNGGSSNLRFHTRS